MPRRPLSSSFYQICLSTTYGQCIIKCAKFGLNQFINVLAVGSQIWPLSLWNAHRLWQLALVQAVNNNSMPPLLLQISLHSDYVIFNRMTRAVVSKLIRPLILTEHWKMQCLQRYEAPKKLVSGVLCRVMPTPKKICVYWLRTLTKLSRTVDHLASLGLVSVICCKDSVTRFQHLQPHFTVIFIHVWLAFTGRILFG